MLRTETAAGGPLRIAWAWRMNEVFRSSARSSNMLALHGTIARSAHMRSERLVSVWLPGPSATM